MKIEKFEDGDWRNFKEDFNIHDVNTYPVMVVSTDFKSGVVYAEAAGLENYRVFTQLRYIQGCRGRALVVTPKYISEAQKTDFLMPEFWAAWQTVSMTTSAGLGFYHE